jgi:hypothetical protein
MAQYKDLLFSRTNFEGRCLSAKERLRTIKETIKTECASGGLHERELKAGGRRAVVAEVRAKIARKLVGEYGMTLAEVARNVGV